MGEQAPRVKKIRLGGKIVPALRQVLVRLRDIVGFRALMTLLLVATVTVVSGFVLVVTNKFVAESKLRDVWSILFLELERRAADLSQKLLSFDEKSTTTPSGHDGGAIFGFSVADGGLTWQGGVPSKALHLKDFGIDNPSDLVEWNLVRYREQNYVLRRTSKTQVVLSPFRGALDLVGAKEADEHSVIYIATRQGLLIYANHPDVTAEDFRSRSLVQKFITLSVWQGQVEFFDKREREVYGFFNEVQGTNLVIFAETMKSAVTDAVDGMTRRLFMIVLIALITAVVVLQIPIVALLRPVGLLVSMTKKVAAGDFNARGATGGVGEIAILSRAFSDMTGALKTREETIQRLMLEQQEKVRLEGEMKTAHLVQENFFPVDEIDVGEMAVRAFFASANECGGDWWGGLNVCGKLLLCVGDATGHGVPSALITAATHSCAVTLEEILPNLSPDKWNAAFMASVLNKAVCKSGRGTVKMTFFLALIDPKTGEMEYVNASHEPPLIYRQPADQAMFTEGVKANLESIECKPDPSLGASLESTYHSHRLTIGPGDVVIWYTDGITEARDPFGKEFGEGRLCRTLLKVAGRDPSDIRQYITAKVKEFCAGRPHDDDVTLVILKRKRQAVAA